MKYTIIFTFPRIQSAPLPRNFLVSFLYLLLFTKMTPKNLSSNTKKKNEKITCIMPTVAEQGIGSFLLSRLHWWGWFFFFFQFSKNTSTDFSSVFLIVSSSRAFYCSSCRTAYRKFGGWVRQNKAKFCKTRICNKIVDMICTAGNK